MGKYSSKVFSVIFILTFVNSLIFYQLNVPENQQISNFLDGSSISNRNKINDEDNSSNDKESNNKIRQELIDGDFKTRAFFSGGGGEAGVDLIDDPEYPDEPENNNTYYYPNVVEWVPYDYIASGSHIPKIEYWRACSSFPHTWPSTANVWHHLIEKDNPREPSKMFSPVFTEDHEIKGRVYYLTYIETNDAYGGYFSEYIDIDMRFSLHLFNPVDNNKTLLTSVEQAFTVNITSMQRTFSSEITGTHTIWM